MEFSISSIPPRINIPLILRSQIHRPGVVPSQMFIIWAAASIAGYFNYLTGASRDLSAGGFFSATPIRRANFRTTVVELASSMHDMKR